MQSIFRLCLVIECQLLSQSYSRRFLKAARIIKKKLFSIGCVKFYGKEH